MAAFMALNSAEQQYHIQIARQPNAQVICRRPLNVPKAAFRTLAIPDSGH